jgi:hypothetical protein
MDRIIARAAGIESKRPFRGARGRFGIGRRGRSAAPGRGSTGSLLGQGQAGAAARSVETDRSTQSVRSIMHLTGTQGSGE